MVAADILAAWMYGVARVRAGVLSRREADVQAADAMPIQRHFHDYLSFCRLAGQADLHVANKSRTLFGVAEVCQIRKLSELRSERAQGYLRWLQERGRSARTRNHARQTLVAFGNWAVARRRLEESDLTLLPRACEDLDRRRVRRALTPEEAGRLLSVAGESGRRLWYCLALLMGMRRGELGRLDWKDVNWVERTVSIANRKAGRIDVLPVHPELFAELYGQWGRMGSPLDGPVFSAMVTPLTVAADMRRAGVGGDGVVDLHSMRTTLATWLAAVGVSPAVAMMVLRHRDVRTTMRNYTRLRIDQVASAMSCLSVCHSNGMESR